MSIIWIILGVLWIVVLAIIIYSVIWVLANLSKGRKDPEHFEKIKQKSDEQIRKNDEQIRKNDERVRRNDERIQQHCERIQQNDEYLEKNEKVRKVLREINILTTRNAFTQEEMKEITRLSNHSAELTKNNTDLSEPILGLLDESTKLTKRETAIITTFREKKRDELQPELEELGRRIQEIVVQIEELEVQKDTRQLEIDIVDAELAKWAELGRSRLT